MQYPNNGLYFGCRLKNFDSGECFIFLSSLAHFSPSPLIRVFQLNYMQPIRMKYNSTISLVKQMEKGNSH